MKTAISFDEWWEENYMVVSTDRTEAEDIYNLGQQSQQAKIDELQAKVDSAVKAIMICEEYDHAEKLDEIYNLLKGSKDEN